jgi:DNA-binding transcriptional ArsR family regulator
VKNASPDQEKGVPDAAGPAAPSRIEPPMLANPQLVAAMGHPTRAHAVTVLNERVACAAEIGRALGKPARHVSYHLKQLEKLGVIELVKVEETAGGRTTGRFYRALVRSWYDPESWRQIERTQQSGITADILAACNGDMTAAVTSATIHFPDSHISRTPLTLDGEGYRDLVDRLDALLPEVIAAQQRAASRMTRQTETVLAKVHIIQFPCPDLGRSVVPLAPVQTDDSPPDLGDAAVLSALEHPTRVHALMVLNERVSSAAEIGRELDLPSDHVAYHLKRLRSLGLIESVEIREPPRHLKTSRFYRALVRPWFDLESWKAVDPRRQAAITASILGLCNADVVEAVRTGTINESDSHISRTPLIVDRRGYRDIGELLDGLIPELLTIQERSALRIEKGADRITFKVHLFQFESPDPDGAKEPDPEEADD